MNNVGDTKTFILNGQTPSEPITYVWNWWDHSVDVISSGTVSKRLTMGGNPSDNYLVRYSVMAVDDVGQHEVFSDSMVVNNPPSILPGSARLASNGYSFPFATYGTVAAYDLEGDTLQFAWFGGGRFLGGGTNTHDYGHANGTYAGTDVGFRMVSVSGIDYTVVTNGSLVCYIWDQSGGTTAVEFPVYGRNPQAITLSSNSAAAGVSADAFGTPTLRIGANEFAQFVVYTPSQTHPLSFRWAYFGSNGWAQTQYSNGTTTAFSDGSFQSLDLKGVANETVGEKTAECFVRDNSTGQISTIKLGINLIANDPPTINGAVIVTPAAPHVGNVVSLEVNASDPNGDLIHYSWNITNPFNVNYYGRKIFIPTQGMPAGTRISGVIYVRDNLGTATQLSFQAPPLI